MLIYQEDVYNVMFELLKEVNNHILIEPQKMIKLLNETKNILKLFNNNYRSIYHLENFIVTIINTIA
jgi:mRNA-degrading endonuclease RelE of RelBE toxin-antitoxin system